jgi:antitoxin MazE
MRIPLRKLGNSSGIIIPRPLLRQIGVETGDELEMKLKGGQIVLSPVEKQPRSGWANAAQTIANSNDEALEWSEFSNAEDGQLQW